MSRPPLTGLFIVGLIVVFGVIIVGIMFPTAYGALGTWGDFTGGLLNPLLTFLTLIGVLSTISLQRDELKLTREEMRRSADALEQQARSIKREGFESTFFEMLKLHNDIVNSIDLTSQDGRETRGRDCFRVFYTRLTKEYRENRDKAGKKYDDERILRLSYFQFWKDAQIELGHYFRYLYNVCRLIENSEQAEEYHVKLLRSQLSNQELLLLFYNTVSPYGRNFEKYTKKYKLFDNLPVARLLDKDHANLVDSESFGDNPMITRPTMDRP